MPEALTLTTTSIPSPPKPASLWKESEVDRLSSSLGEPASLLNLRLQAFGRTKVTPWPTALDESWRRNNPRRIGRDKFGLWTKEAADAVTPSRASSDSFDAISTSRISLRNCELVRSDILDDHSISGLSAGSLEQGYNSCNAKLLEQLALDVPDDKDSPAVSLYHLAFSQGGSYCIVPENWSSPDPLVIHHQLNHSGKALFPLNIVHVGRRSEATIILEQDDQSDLDAWLGVSTRISLAEGAKLNLIAINRAGKPVNFYEHLSVSLKKDANFSLTWFDNTAGWTVMRREASLAGKGAEARLKGAYVGADDTLYDLRTLQDHTAPSTFSDLMFKAVNFHSAKSVYQGLIKVSPDAINANAYQLNRNLLMSPEARADSIPKLEILVDEVKCTHGASVGKPDANALFYLRSRGISEKDAIRLIVEGFLGEAGNLISNPQILEYWREAVINRFEAVYENAESTPAGI